MCIAVGGMHGNEPAGVHALLGLLSRMESDRPLRRGDFVALAGNLAALAEGKRYVDEDLNRRFDGRAGGEGCESKEQQELLAAIDDAINEARGPVVLLDLHTTSGPGGPFAVFSDTIASRNFARRFPVPVVLGLEEQLAGTLVDFIGLRGHVTVGFEGGQHDDPAAVACLEAIVWVALEQLGLVASAPRTARRVLSDGSAGAPRIVEIAYRHGIAEDDDFHMLPGFRSFQPVAEGQVVAQDAGGGVAAPTSGLLLMPLYQKQGNDGFFVVRPVSAFWLWLSAGLRHLRAGRIVHWLPGIARVDGAPHRVEVDRGVARWYSLEVLHLLGFRRRREDANTLVMERRAHDLI